MSAEFKIQKTTQPKTKPNESDLSFGRFFTDHLFAADYSNQRGWYDPRIVPYQSFQIDPGASVLHYGQALFEGMKAFRGEDGKIRLFRPEMNWKRLCSGAERLCMVAPKYDLFIQGLTQFVAVDADWVPSSPMTALYLRPTLIGNEPFLGVRPSHQYLFYIIGSPVGSYYSQQEPGAQAVKIWVETADSRCAPGGIGAVKAGGNYASSLRAATEARTQGYAQVLWLDACEKKYIEEVGTMNVFFKIAGTVITPPLSGTILPGVMRDTAIQLIQQQKLPFQERKISLDEVLNAHTKGDLQEAFGTGTAASITAVGALGFKDRVISIQDGKPGSVAQGLFKAITDIQYGRAADTMNWMMEIPS